MLSRTAEAFFWIGRYVERAEYTARFAKVHYDLLLEIADTVDHAPIWRWYLEGNGELSLYEKLFGRLDSRSVLEFLALAPQNPNSLHNLIHAARSNARSIQDQLSSEVWTHLNEFYLALRGQTAEELWQGPHRALMQVQNSCYTLDGVLGSTMLHDDGWVYYRLGKYVERAGRTARLLDHPVLIKSAPEPGALPEFHQCLAILKSASAYEAYRKVYRADVSPRTIVEFLVFHPRFPRAIHFCAWLIRQMLNRLSTANRGPETREIERLGGQFSSDLEFGSVEDVYKMGLGPFLTQVIEQLDRIANSLARTYFRSAGYGEPAAAETPRRRTLMHTLAPPSNAVRTVLSIRHQFTYRYNAPVSEVHTLMRLFPPQRYGLQRRLDVRWHLDPPADHRQFTDAFGNPVWQLDHPRIEREIDCTVELRVETQAVYLVDGSLAFQGVRPQESECAVEPAEFTRLTTLVDRSEPMAILVDRFKSRRLSSIELVESFMHQVHAHMRYEPGRTHVGTKASEAFAHAAGVCQDYAHVMLSLCRLAGLPARYVSGYLPGEGRMHAWVEALLPVGPAHGQIWVAYDPTHQRRCDERYVTVAVGRDYRDVAPTSGYYSGDAGSKLDVNVSVVMDAHGATDERPSTLLTSQSMPALHDGEQQQ
ncbi:MAG TPA: alpha-E domain-containing protein [Nitrospiria bacterium]|nr:alpha-E domain-containing protein [Nitrospiria bacterium]